MGRKNVLIIRENLACLNVAHTVEGKLYVGLQYSNLLNYI
jgi:hypothetical protein